MRSAYLFVGFLVLASKRDSFRYMTVRKVNLYSLGVLALFSAFLAWVAGVRDGLDKTMLATVFFFTLIGWVVGILIGVGLSVVVKRPAIEPYLYLSGQIAVLLTVVIFVVIAIYTNGTPPGREHERAVGNTRDNTSDNHNFIDLDNMQSIPYRMDYIRTAFRKLESASGDPNSFHLEKFSSRWKDTVINSSQDTIFSVLFTYLKHDKVLFAKVTVLGDSVLINSMDSETKPDQQFINTGAWGHSTDLGEIKSRLNDLPDSTRKKILDILSQ
jgi:hypothetical protein